MKPGRHAKTVTDAFKEKMTEKIEDEEDEKRKDILVKALNRGIELLEGKQHEIL